jgi:hypothetical protein
MLFDVLDEQVAKELHCTDVVALCLLFTARLTVASTGCH